MKFQPLAPWWLIVGYGLIFIGIIGWQFWQLSREQRKNRLVTQKWIRRTVLLFLPLLIALGPSVQGGVSAPGIANIDIVFAIDTTPSIAALDYVDGKQRLEGVKQDLLALGNELKGAQIEIITFDSSASVILPPTNDRTVFTTAVQSLTPQISSYSRGSDINEPIELIAKQLSDMKDVYPQHYRMLFFISDGEQTASDSIEAFEPIKEFIDGGAVLGYGTAAGARMPAYSGLEFGTETPSKFVKTIDPASNAEADAISKANPETLQQIANDLGISYQDRNSGGPIDPTIDASKAKLLVDLSKRVVHYINLYWLLAIPYTGLILWEWLDVVTKLFELRQPKTEKPKTSKRKVGKHA